MSRARILADYVSSGDELALKAPITNAALVTPNLGTPSAGVMTNMTGAVTASLVDNAVTLAKMAGGTDGNIISFDASGDPVAIATGTSGHFLKSQGAGAQPVFAAAGGGLASQQVFTASGTWTKPSGITLVKVTVVGGGGGGGGNTSGANNNGGGGGGGC